MNLKLSMVIAAFALFVASLYKLCHAIVNAPSGEKEDDHGTKTIP